MKTKVRKHRRRTKKGKTTVKKHKRKMKKRAFDVGKALRQTRVRDDGYITLDYPSGRDVLKTKVVMMSPDDFLQSIPKHARQVSETYYNTKTRTRKPFSDLKSKIESSDEKVPLPFLSLDKKGKIASEYAFDGAHRANLAKKMGLTLFPVRVNTVGPELDKPISRLAEEETARMKR